MKKIIDTHAHLNFKAYQQDLEAVIQRTLNGGMLAINIGTKYETSQRALEIAEKYEGIYASVGLHPIYSTPNLIRTKTDKEEGEFEIKGEEFLVGKYEQLAKSKKVIAIGEAGLDYYYKPKTTKKKEIFKQKQKEIFIAQLELAKKINRPVILHCRLAHNDLINIIKNYNLKGVIHCFTGDKEEAKKYLGLGLCLGFNGIIFNRDLKEVIQYVPLAKVLVETDCPYLTPPKREGRNEPLFIKDVIEEIAQLKKINLNQAIETTTQNAQNLFGIK